MNRRRARGAALLLVLWLLVLLTGLLAVFALSARTEGLQARFLARSTEARAAAEAGVEVAVLHLQSADEARRWLPDGRAYRFDLDGQAIEVRCLDESAKVDVNVATPDLLIGLMQALGIPEAQARAVSGAIMDWRDTDSLLNAEGGAEDPDYAAAGLPYGAKDRPFDTIAELQQVLGVDAAIYRRLAPYITVYSGAARPNPAFAAEPVLRALGLNEPQLAQALAARAAWEPGQPTPASPDGSTLAGPGSGTYSISSHATRTDGTRVRITAILRLGGSGAAGSLYTPLSWRVGETD